MIDQFQSFKVNNLVESGYTQEAAINALNIWDWDLSQARNFLQSHSGNSKQEDDELKRIMELSKSQEGIGQFQYRNEMNFLADLEPLTLEERQRIGNMPVGLKNIGNTCYLNSFIQALYHLPVVMEKVMALQETNELQRQSSLNAMKRVECSYNLIVQMKTLFAYMTKSEKKYADPTKMIRNIVDDFGNQMKIGDQQDISEVSEGFMTRIHEGFQAIADPFSHKNEPNPFGDDEPQEEEEKERSDVSENDSSDAEKRDLLQKVEDYSKNNKPEGFIKDLFYGRQVETTEWSKGNSQDMIEDSEFLLLLLNIEHSNNLYEAWDKAFRFEVESGDATFIKKRWITKIPKVLTFNILRVVYDHETQMPKKIHDEFSFDKEIYIDRFVAKNASRFPDFMNTLDRLKAKKQALEESLKKYKHEGKDLLEYLQVARKFIEKQRKVDEGSKEMEAPDEHELSLWDPEEIGKIGMKKSDLKTTVQWLKNYENHLQESVQAEKDSLQETINDLGNAYTVLKEFPYTLHCIVIHEGEDNSGHYYSYIKNHIENAWFKYDDHRVSEVTEEQVLGEAFGLTKLKTSAYLVMYVAKSILENTDSYKSEYDYYFSLIPKDILKEVNKENYFFNEQLQEAKNKELANEIMDYYKSLDLALKKKLAGTTDTSLISFPLFWFKNNEVILCQHTILDTAIQEKHPAKLSIECLDQTLESTLLKAFNRDIIYLTDQRRKNLESLKQAYYLNIEMSYMIHYTIDCLMSENYSTGLTASSYVLSIDHSSALVQKILQKKKDVFIKQLHIFTFYLISKSNLDIVNDKPEDAIDKISLVSMLALNYIPHSELYENTLTFLKHILSIVEPKLGKHFKVYSKLLSGIEKKTITKVCIFGVWHIEPFHYTQDSQRD